MKRFNSITLAFLLASSFLVSNSNVAQAASGGSKITAKTAISILKSSNKLTISMINSKPFTLKSISDQTDIYTVDKFGSSLIDSNSTLGEDREYLVGKKMFITTKIHEFTPMEEEIVADLGLNRDALYTKVDTELISPKVDIREIVKSTRTQAMDLWPDIDTDFMNKDDLFLLKTSKSKVKGKTVITQVLDYRDNALKGQVGHRQIFTIVNGIIAKIDEYGVMKVLGNSTILDFNPPVIVAPEGPYLDWLKIINDPRYVGN